MELKIKHTGFAVDVDVDAVVVGAAVVVVELASVVVGVDVDACVVDVVDVFRSTTTGRSVVPLGGGNSGAAVEN